MKLRLDKYLADSGAGTRSEVKKAILAGRVCVNETIIKRPDSKVETDSDKVLLDGQPFQYTAYEYYMLNKPAGVLSASSDCSRKTVLDLIDGKQRRDLFPVGRLDLDTEGLMLITNDGVLAHRLLSPKKHVDKVYYARIRGKVETEDILRFREGIDIGEKKPALPAKLLILRQGEESEVELTIQEGKFHQVKRMFAALGKEVLYLKRLRMGALVLDETLQPGAYRKLTKKELDTIW